MNTLIPQRVNEFLQNALSEDIGYGDLTTSFTVDPQTTAKAIVLAKESFVIAGLTFFAHVFRLLSDTVNVHILKGDGVVAQKGDILCELAASAQVLLMGERVALNILQRLSAIATKTNRFVEIVKDLPVRIVDTRKTTPGMRYMEKYAVRVGGGSNHRFGLYDGILIKDNHITAAGGITAAVEKAQRHRPLLTRIEVEVKNMAELQEALANPVDVIMLDNMTPEEMTEAVKVARATKDIIIEASGNVTQENVRVIALTGVDVISSGSLTHSVKAADISMKFV